MSPSLCLQVCVSKSVSPSLCLQVYVSKSVSLSLCLQVYVSKSMSPSLCLQVCVSKSVSPAVSESQITNSYLDNAMAFAKVGMSGSCLLCLWTWLPKFPSLEFDRMIYRINCFDKIEVGLRCLGLLYIPETYPCLPSVSVPYHV